MKLSKSQYEVMKRLQEGWEMGVSWLAIGYTRIKTIVTLQKNGLGNGGEAYYPRTESIVSALAKKGLIEAVGERLPHGQIWVLTEKGKNLQLQNPSLKETKQ